MILGRWSRWLGPWLAIEGGDNDATTGLRFHPQQLIEQDGEEIVVRFYSGGLCEIAEHLFTWGGEVRIEGPEELREMMRERLSAAGRAVV